MANNDPPALLAKDCKGLTPLACAVKTAKSPEVVALLSALTDVTRPCSANAIIAEPRCEEIYYVRTERPAQNTPNMLSLCTPSYSLWAGGVCGCAEDASALHTELFA